MAREMVSPTCVCANTPLHSGLRTQREKGELTSLPWYRLVGVAIPPVIREGGRAGLPKKGKWSPRGISLPKPAVIDGSEGCARGTGKAGENGQNSGEVGGSSALDKTVGSRVWRHTQGSSGRPASARVGVVLEDGSGSQSTGSPASRILSSARRCVNVQSDQRKGRKVVAACSPSVAVRDCGH